MDDGLAPVAAAVSAFDVAPVCIRERLPESLPDPVRAVVLDVVGNLNCMRKLGE